MVRRLSGAALAASLMERDREGEEEGEREREEEGEIRVRACEQMGPNLHDDMRRKKHRFRAATAAYLATTRLLATVKREVRKKKKREAEMKLGARAIQYKD